MTDHASDGKKSIVFVNRYFYPDQSATSQVLTDLTRGLAARGFVVHVVCSRQLYDDPSVRLPAQERAFGARIHRVATSHFGRHRLIGRAIDYATFYISSAFILMRILKEEDVLVVKTDPPLMSLLAVPIAALRRVTLVNWQQDVFPEVASHLGANPLPRWIDYLLCRLRDSSLRAARMNVLVGSRMLEYFAGRKIPRHQLCVIENWSDSDLIVPKPPAASQLRLKLGLADKFVVGYSGNLGRAHDYEAMLGAAEALRDDDSVSFLFIGAGMKMEALKARVAERRLPAVRFLPYQPRESLEDSLAAADVHLVSLIPSLEGFIVPSKFYGILAAGRPIVFIGDLDGELARITVAARCGLVVGAGQSVDLVGAIRRLQCDEIERNAMGMAARQLLSERYSARRGVDSWIALLASASAAQGGAA
jgi:colanic acid biosynthesis glycosyl transferase WcaI